jgi:hypothetical protein
MRMRRERGHFESADLTHASSARPRTHCLHGNLAPSRVPAERVRPRSCEPRLRGADTSRARTRCTPRSESPPNPHVCTATPRAGPRGGANRRVDTLHKAVPIFDEAQRSSTKKLRVEAHERGHFERAYLNHA